MSQHGKDAVELKDKYYGTGKEPAPAVKADGVMIGVDKKSSRKELMAMAKSRGIKYHRILNRQELWEELREGVTADDIKQIVAAAIKRWKKV